MIIYKHCQKQFRIFNIIFVLTLLAFKQINTQDNKTCTPFCQLCHNTNSTVCQACSDGYQLSQIGNCINQSIIDNCMLFSITNSCLTCKPSYRLQSNKTCTKMIDGCAISDVNGTCKRCLDGAIKNIQGNCDIQYINCIKQSQTSECVQCQIGYSLANGKCLNNDSNCQYIQPITGLCIACNKGYSLVGYQCVLPINSTRCYITSSDKKSCIQCKNGYKSYCGKCLAMNKIQFMVMELTNISGKCLSYQYFNLKNKSCVSLPLNCQIFDYGFMKCVSCHTNYALIQGLCIQSTLKHCLSFSQTNPLSCSQCQQKYYLFSNNSNTTICKQYPLYCTNVDKQKCISCIAGFVLNSKYYCQDANCKIFNQSNYQCLSCKQFFNKNNNSVCTFFDPNCISVGSDNICNQCKQYYKYNAEKKICKYRQQNCKIFFDEGKCIECNSKYFLNKSVNHCQKLPYKCLNVNSNGMCIHCQQGFYLMQNRQCEAYTLFNCDIKSQDNKTTCIKCKQNYYMDINGICKSLPPLCQQFDPTQYLCSKCNKNAMIKNGRCYDNNCQYFGENSQCLGCKKGFQYNKKGQCVIIQSDRNCKQYINGQCRVCSDRYFFDKQWKCTNVSALCKNYDHNNGECTSCFPGYILYQGQCIKQSQQTPCDQYIDITKTACKKCHKGYKLNQQQLKCYLGQGGCAQRSPTNRTCLQCEQHYTLDRGSGYCLKINIQAKINTTSNIYQTNVGYVDERCATLTSDGNSCLKCMDKMYYDTITKKCIPIDPHCKTSNTSSGTCIQCQSGYKITDNMMECMIDRSINKNCKIFENNTSNCLQCYEGFYYASQYLKCVDLFCKKIQNTTGNCLICEVGYVANGTQCVLQLNNSLSIDQTNSSININNNKT